jgi:hypothetical protein
MDLAKTLKDTLLGSTSIKTLSETSGANKSQVQQVLQDALPTLVQSMQKNASTKSGADSLSKALSDHAKDDTSNIGSFLKNVDLEDGAKILGHILGDKTSTVETGVAKKSGLTASQAGTILATAAPLLLNLLGQKKEEEDQNENESGGLFSVLASALLGGNDDKNGSSGGNNSLGETLADGLGDVLAVGLGSLLSGGGKSKGKSKSKSSSSGGILGGLIGSLLSGATGTPAADTKKKATTRKTTTKTATAKRATTSSKTTTAKKATTAKKQTTTAKKASTAKTTTKKK